MKKKKEVSSNNEYYNYEKIFMKLQEELNKCETQEDVETFEKLSDGFKKQDAPKELTSYLEASIKRKTTSLINKYNLDLTKLRTIANLYR